MTPALALAPNFFLLSYHPPRREAGKDFLRLPLELLRQASEERCGAMAEESPGLFEPGAVWTQPRGVGAGR
jgi:hypothetical protein